MNYIHNLIYICMKISDELEEDWELAAQKQELFPIAPLN